MESFSINLTIKTEFSTNNSVILDRVSLHAKQVLFRYSISLLFILFYWIWTPFLCFIETVRVKGKCEPKSFAVTSFLQVMIIPLTTLLVQECTYNLPDAYLIVSCFVFALLGWEYKYNKDLKERFKGLDCRSCIKEHLWTRKRNIWMILPLLCITFFPLIVVYSRLRDLYLFYREARLSLKTSETVSRELELLTRDRTPMILVVWTISFFVLIWLTKLWFPRKKLSPFQRIIKPMFPSWNLYIFDEETGEISNRDPSIKKVNCQHQL